MCRLSLLNVPAVRKVVDPRAFFHVLMLQANAEGQNDGCGASDGNKLFRSKTPYFQTTLFDHYEEFDADRLWLGHVRSASAATEKSDAAAHPYRLETFIGAHNGVFSVKKVRKLPTDSLEYFALLDEAIKTSGGDIKDAVELVFDGCKGDINFERSKYAIIILKDKKAYIWRNGERELFIARRPDGEWFAVQTSQIALEATLRFFKIEAEIDKLEKGALFTASVDGFAGEKIAMPEYAVEKYTAAWTWEYPVFEKSHSRYERKDREDKERVEKERADKERAEKEETKEEWGKFYIPPSSTYPDIYKSILNNDAIYIKAMADVWKEATRFSKYPEHVNAAFAASKRGVYRFWFEYGEEEVKIISAKPIVPSVANDLVEYISRFSKTKAYDMIYYAFITGSETDLQRFLHLYNKATRDDPQKFATTTGKRFAVRVMGHWGAIPMSDTLKTVDREFVYWR